MENTPEIIGAFVSLAKSLEELGLPGLLAVLLLGPLMTVIAVFALDFLRRRAERQDAEERRREAKEDRKLLREVVDRYREEALALEERHREASLALVEKHRGETANILHDLGEKHAEVSQFYRDNVELVKSTQRLATDMRDIIVNNTRAVERLTNAVETNFFCPAAREAATGKK